MGLTTYQAAALSVDLAFQGPSRCQRVKAGEWAPDAADNSWRGSLHC